MSDITIILSAWKRPQLLARQIAMCRAQTRPPTEVWVWNERQSLTAGNDGQLHSLADNWITTSSRGTYGRFSAALLAQTRFVAIIDDDMVPGPKFLEASTALVEQSAAAVAAGGMRLNSLNYSESERFGWEVRSTCDAEVDIGLNAWVLERAWLPVLWIDPAPNPHNGEDIHLSWALKHYLARATITPAQADDDRIGSQVDLGQDAVSLCRMPQHRAERSRIVEHFFRRGWQTVNQIGSAKNG